MIYLGYLQEFPVDDTHARLLYLGCDELAKRYKEMHDRNSVIQFMLNNMAFEYPGTDLADYTATS